MKVITRAKTKIKDIYKKYGWKAVASLIAYYLIRDLTLYVGIPYLALQGLDLGMFSFMQK